MDRASSSGEISSRVCFELQFYGVDPNDPSTQKSGNPANGIPAGTQTYGGPLLSGSGYSVGLFVGPLGTPDAMLQHLQTAPFRTGAASGFFFSFQVTLDGIPGGSFATVQFRAWDNAGGTVTSWSQVMMAGGSVAAGVSEPFTVGPLVGPLIFDMFPTPVTSEFRSFNLTVVPEPSFLALFGLGGIAGLFSYRRQKRSIGSSPRQ